MIEYLVERQVGDLTIRLDHSLCVGFGHCVDEAATAFKLNDDDLVDFVSPEQVERERLIHACGACPVEALSIFDKDGTQLVPEES